MKSKKLSKYKNLIGEEKSYKFTNINLVSEVTEGRLLACNGSFIAASWNGVPGSVAILDTAFPTNVKFNTPVLKGHKRSVFDLEFSPFKDTILATASDDATVKIWEIPSQGLRENLSKDLLTYKEHTRRAAFVKFNPVASDVIASASTEYSVHVWNLNKGEFYSKGEYTDMPTCLDWNTNGSLVAVTTKKKKLFVFDPRTKKSVFDSVISESPRSSKFTWVDENMIVTTGFSKSNVKELKLWDIRKVSPELKSEGPVQKLTIDNSLTVTTPFYDHESKLLFTSAKGELSVHVYDFNDSTIYKLTDFKSNTPALSLNMFERKILDYNKCEIDRFIHYNNKKEISFISFKLSRKKPEYEPDLYPPVYSGEPALTYEQWVSGENKEPIKKEIHLIGNKNASMPDNEIINEVKKEGGNKEEVKDNDLEEKIKIIEEKVNKKQAIYDKLFKEKEELDKKLKELRKKKLEASDRLNEAFRQRNKKAKEKEEKEVKIENQEKEKENIENEENKEKVEEIEEKAEKKEIKMQIEEVKEVNKNENEEEKKEDENNQKEKEKKEDENKLIEEEIKEDDNEINEVEKKQIVLQKEQEDKEDNNNPNEEVKKEDDVDKQNEEEKKDNENNPDEVEKNKIVLMGNEEEDKEDNNKPNEEEKNENDDKPNDQENKESDDKPNEENKKKIITMKNEEEEDNN